MDYIYLVLEETDAWGAWTDPKNAAEWYYDRDLKDSDSIERGGRFFTVDEMVEHMLCDSDYPVLEKILVNPKGKNVWTMDK